MELLIIKCCFLCKWYNKKKSECYLDEDFIGVPLVENKCENWTCNQKHIKSFNRQIMYNKFLDKGW